jgi:large subunit ribosomal protein L9
MKVILKKDVSGVGKKYDIKEVADGYANNYLIPNRLAEYAGPEAVKKAQMARAAVEEEMKVQDSLMAKQIEALKGVKVVLDKKANEKGHLFEKIHTEDIVAALKEQARIEISSDSIKMPEPVKEIGDHVLFVEVGKNRGEFTLSVVATT